MLDQYKLHATIAVSDLPMDQPYGLRQGRVADPYCHHWLIGTPLDR